LSNLYSTLPGTPVQSHVAKAKLAKKTSNTNTIEICLNPIKNTPNPFFEALLGLLFACTEMPLPFFEYLFLFGQKGTKKIKIHFLTKWD
jgi:hypothetical protein